MNPFDSAENKAAKAAAKAKAKADAQAAQAAASANADTDAAAQAAADEKATAKAQAKAKAKAAKAKAKLPSKGDMLAEDGDLTTAERNLRIAVVEVSDAAKVSSKADNELEVSDEPTAEMREASQTASIQLDTAEGELADAEHALGLERRTVDEKNAKRLDKAKSNIAQADKSMVAAHAASENLTKRIADEAARRHTVDTFDQDSQRVRVRGLVDACWPGHGAVANGKVVVMTITEAAKFVGKNLVEYVDEPD